MYFENTLKYVLNIIGYNVKGLNGKCTVMSGEDLCINSQLKKGMQLNIGKNNHVL